MPQLLVSALRYSWGMSSDLRHEPVPAIVGPEHDAATDVFPESGQAIVGNIPLPRPRIELTVPDVPIEEVCETLAFAAQSHKLPVPFFIRLIWQESRFNPGAISPVGAQGVAQFMPATAAAMGLRNPFDPLEALHSSARLLRELMGQFGNLGLAAAAYNAGPKKIFDWLAKRGKLPEETRNYVQSITGHPAERWRITRPGVLALDVPKRAPCHGIEDMALVLEVPAPPPPPKKRARARLIAKGKAGSRTKVASGKKGAVDISAASKRGKVRTAAKPVPLIARASASRKAAKVTKGARIRTAKAR